MSVASEMKTVMSMLRIQAEQIEKLTIRVDKMDRGQSSSSSSSSYSTKSSGDVTVTLNNLRREQQCMHTLLSAVERQAMSTMDVKDDVAMLQKSDGRHKNPL